MFKTENNGRGMANDGDDIINKGKYIYIYIYKRKKPYKTS